MITLISQRIMDSKNGFVDALEQNYSKYFVDWGFELIPVPNAVNSLNFYFKLPVERIILTGGGDVGDKNSKERDEIEKCLIRFAAENKIPLIGICRGMQMINSYFGGSIKDIGNKSHVATEHEIIITERIIKEVLGDKTKVNSYHDKCIKEEGLSDSLRVFAKSPEGFVEGLFHPSLPIAGIQWHPERDSPDKRINEKIMDSFLNEKLFWKK